MLEIEVYTQLDPGWLELELAEAASDLALSMPLGVARMSPGLADTETPLEADDARRLREKMAARYREWTGRDLAVDLEEDRL